MSQGKVSEKSGNLDMYIEWQPCIPTFRSLAAIVSEKSTIFMCSHRKAQVTKFDLALN